MSDSTKLMATTAQQLSTNKVRVMSVCAICKDDISTNLGRRRLLFHLENSLRNDPTSQVVKQIYDFMSLFESGAKRRQCDLTKCSEDLIGSMSAKWCCRKCERMIDNIYKKFQHLQQFYNQYKDCPLYRLLHSLSVDNDSDIEENSEQNNEQNREQNSEQNSEQNREQNREQMITIQGLVIPESQLNEEFNESNVAMKSKTENQLKTKSNRRKSTDDNFCEEICEENSQSSDNQKEMKSNVNSKLDNTSNVNKKMKTENNCENESTNSQNECKTDSILNEMKSQTDKQIVSSVFNHYYEGVMRAMLNDEITQSVAIREVARFVWRECLSAGTQVAKLSNSLESVSIPELKRLIQTNLPSTLLLFTVLTGKEKTISAPIVSMISILLYSLNSHANLFQKIMATILFNSKCNSSTIEKLHSYKVCIAYETLVSFLDRNTQTTQIQKMIKDFQF